MAFSPDGRTVLTGSEDKKARLWETSGKRLWEAGKRIATLSHEGEVLAVAISPNGRTALTAGMDTKARLWALGEQPAALEAHQDVPAGSNPKLLDESAEPGELKARP